MKNEFYYASADGKTQVHSVEWIPEGEVKAVLQICHGMAEHIERYHEFATFLTAQGYYVVGHDHLGHGKSVVESGTLGYFHETSGNEYVLADIHSLRIATAEKYPNIPYFMLGHSMGSFLARQYIGVHGSGLSGAIIMGTGEQPSVILGVGKMLCKIIAIFKGWKYRSNLVDSMAAGGYDKHFKNEIGTLGWLSRNVDNRKRYVDDPLCGYVFTVNGYYHMFSGMLAMNASEKAEKIPKFLPIYLVAGQEDPVGNFGKSVENVFKNYIKCGMTDVQMKLYAGDRHEILNEDDKEQVYRDIWKWMEKRI